MNGIKLLKNKYNVKTLEFKVLTLYFHIKTKKLVNKLHNKIWPNKGYFLQTLVFIMFIYYLFSQLNT